MITNKLFSTLMCFKMSFVPDGKAEFLAAIIPVISIT